ncbi:hypothetical protein R1sor_006775 [Riccia sorocarpa]|uniref:Uncharacterized protein n=1 Tax=Riccia sorocarpa TaxID=122646 RepID=A0ABD3HUT7_9MARC
MPVKRSIDCARIVVGNALQVGYVSRGLPPTEPLLLRIALALPFSAAACETNVLPSFFDSIPSPPGSGAHTSSKSRDALPASKRRDLDNSVVGGSICRSLGYKHSFGCQTGTGGGIGRLTPFNSCQKHGFSSTAVEVETEPLVKGQSWKGRGWNQPPTSEVLAVQLTSTESEKDSIAAQFDNIRDLEEKLKFLETCGLGDNQLLQMRKRLPSAVKNTFLKLSMKKLIEVATFLDEEVGVERKDFGNLLFANPYIAGSSVEECLRPKVQFLRERGITKEEMGKMVLRSPQILTYSLEGKLLAIEQKLLEVGLKDGEIGRVFVRYPALIGTSISKFDKNVESLKEAGISEVAKAIFKIPQIMSLSLGDKYKGILQFLQDELHLQHDQISKIVSSQISILSFSVETNIRPKIGYFLDMGLQNNDIARLVVKYPNIFCHSLENSIKPKVQYLVKEMKLQVMELIAFPHYLSYSLPDRIRPRHEYVRNCGFSYKLSSLLSCCDNVFHKRYPKPAVMNDENFVAVP